MSHHKPVQATLYISQQHPQLRDQVLGEMQGLLRNNTITWRSSEQQDAMAAVLECQMDIIIILLMGGGTSMLAIVPSLLEVNTTTVFVLPLNSLTTDYERRLFEMNIPHQVYKPDIELNLRDNLVIISAGKLQMASWHTALANLAHRGPLACIVMDKAHIPLVAKDYHKSVKHMCDIQSEPVLLVLLSTTLPPSLMSHVSATYLLL